MIFRRWRRLVAMTTCVLLAAGTMAPAAEKKAYPSFGTIERKDPRFDQLIPKDAVLEKIGEGFDWAEGPVWNKKGKYLLFSDIPPNSVMKFKEAEGVTLFLKPSGYTGGKPRGGEPGSNGLHFDAQGRLILCQHGDRRIARLNADNKSFETLADRYEGKRFNSPNDAVFKSNGDLYFTDPPYGLEGLNDDPAKELPFNGVYRLDKDGKVTLLTKEMTFPNGIGFSPDEKTLYVAQSDPKQPIWKAFEVKADGTLGASRVFADSSAWFAAGRKGLPDGLKVDQKGNVFATGPGGVHVFAPDGTHLGTIDTAEATANCGWGEDGSVLYVCADMYLGRIKTGTKGLGF